MDITWTLALIYEILDYIIIIIIILFLFVMLLEVYRLYFLTVKHFVTE